MNSLYLLGLIASFASHAVLVEPSTALLDNKQAFIADLLTQITLEEKVGQLCLISIGGDRPRPRILEEIAAGNIGGTFNTVTRRYNRPMQDAAVQHSQLEIPLFFAYDVIHGHRTIFPISLALASSWGQPDPEQHRPARRRDCGATVYPRHGGFRGAAGQGIEALSQSHAQGRRAQPGAFQHR